jgi:DNA-binding SARP family transcriptional activator
VHRLQRGVCLYRGDYMTGTDDEWAWLERQRLRDLYLDGLYRLTLSYAMTFDWMHVIEWGRRLSQAEPLREDMHRLLMRAYACTGNRGKAIAQYQWCERILRSELSVEPMAETQKLYRQLARSETPLPHEPSQLHQTRSPVSQRFARAQHLLGLSQRQLERAIQELKQVSPEAPSD